MNLDLNKIALKKEKLKRSEIIIPVIAISLTILILNGYFNNKHLESFGNKILVSISLIILIFTLLPTNILYFKGPRIFKFYNFFIWLFITLLLSFVGILFSYMESENGYRSSSISEYFLHFPLLSFLYYQLMRIVHILYFHKEPAYGTPYLKKTIEENIERKITNGELDFTFVYIIVEIILIFILYYSFN